MPGCSGCWTQTPACCRRSFVLVDTFDTLPGPSSTCCLSKQQCGTVLGQALQVGVSVHVNSACDACFFVLLLVWCPYSAASAVGYAMSVSWHIRHVCMHSTCEVCVMGSKRSLCTQLQHALLQRCIRVLLDMFQFRLDRGKGCNSTMVSSKPVFGCVYNSRAEWWQAEW
jgi:hypothetical protein